MPPSAPRPVTEQLSCYLGPEVQLACCCTSFYSSTAGAPGAPASAVEPHVNLVLSWHSSRTGDGSHINNLAASRAMFVSQAYTAQGPQLLVCVDWTCPACYRWSNTGIVVFHLVSSFSHTQYFQAVKQSRWKRERKKQQQQSMIAKNNLLSRVFCVLSYKAGKNTFEQGILLRSTPGKWLKNNL